MRPIKQLSLGIRKRTAHRFAAILKSQNAIVAFQNKYGIDIVPLNVPKVIAVSSMISHTHHRID